MTSVAYGLAFPATRGVLGSPSSSLFDPASLFPAVGGYWNVARAYLDGKLWQHDGATLAVVDGEVGKVWDYSGNGNHLLQTTASKCPILRNLGGYYALEFDDVDDFLQAVFSFSQPFTRVSAAQAISWSAGSNVFWDGAVAPANVNQGDTSPNIHLYAGNGGFPYSSDMTLGANHIVTDIFDGASSKLAVDNNAYTTGNPGTNDPDGTTIGANFNGINNSQIYWFGTIAIAGVMSDPNITSCRTFFGNLAGLAL